MTVRARVPVGSTTGRASRRLLVPAVLLLLAVAAVPSRGMEAEPPVRGLALAEGGAVGPSWYPQAALTLVSHRRHPSLFGGRQGPEALRLKTEGTVGVAAPGEGMRLFLSGNALAMRYLDSWSPPGTRLYVEGGVGLIYTRHRIEGQAWHINCNPVAGVGLEVGGPEGSGWFVALRYSHLSNANLDDDNAGVNALFLQVGRHFPR